MTTTNLNLPELVEGQSSAEVTVNESLARLDLFTHLWILDRDLVDAPGGETNGDVWLVDTPAVGDWAGHDGELAGYSDGYLFQPLKPGMTAYVEDEDIWIAWDGTAWVTINVT